MLGASSRARRSLANDQHPVSPLHTRLPPRSARVAAARPVVLAWAPCGPRRRRRVRPAPPLLPRPPWSASPAGRVGRRLPLSPGGGKRGGEVAGHGRVRRAGEHCPRLAPACIATWEYHLAKQRHGPPRRSAQSTQQLKRQSEPAFGLWAMPQSCEGGWDGGTMKLRLFCSRQGLAFPPGDLHPALRFHCRSPRDRNHHCHCETPGTISHPRPARRTAPRLCSAPQPLPGWPSAPPECPEGEG